MSSMCLHLSWVIIAKKWSLIAKLETGKTQLCFLWISMLPFEHFQGQECAYAFPDSKTKYMPAGAFHNPQKPVFPCLAFSPSPVCSVFLEKNMGVTTHLPETSRVPSVHLDLPYSDLLSEKYFFSPVNNKPPASLSNQNVSDTCWHSAV